jgi:MFS family permease
MPSPLLHCANRDRRNRSVAGFATAAIVALTIGDAATSLMAGAIGRTPEDPAWRYSLAVTGLLGLSSLAIGFRAWFPAKRWPNLASHLALALVIGLLLVANVMASFRRPWAIGVAIGGLIWLMQGRRDWPVVLTIGLDVAGAAIAESVAVSLGIWALGWGMSSVGVGLSLVCLGMLVVALRGLKSAWRLLLS